MRKRSTPIVGSLMLLVMLFSPRCVSYWTSALNQLLAAFISSGESLIGILRLEVPVVKSVQCWDMDSAIS